MPGTEIFERARQRAPKIQLRDVWFVLQQFQQRNLACCLTPQLVTGTIYNLTRKGRMEVAANFGQVVPDPPPNINWMLYALIVRGRIRRLVFKEIARLSLLTKKGTTASEIRKGLMEKRNPLGLNSVLRVMGWLRKLGLVRFLTDPNDRRLKRYVLTPSGQRIARQMQR